MNAKRKKSKKRSVANSKQLKNFTFFIDQALGAKVIPNALKKIGKEVEHLTDIFPSDIDDEKWIEYVGNNNRLAITKDKRLLYRLAEIEAIIKYKARVYRFSSGNMTGDEMAEIIKKTVDKIITHANKNRGPYIISISKSAKLIPLNIDKYTTQK